MKYFSGTEKAQFATLINEQAIDLELVSSLGKTTLLLLLQHLLIPGKNPECQVICQPARDFRLFFLLLWLSFSGSLVAQPIYLSGDDAITTLPLVPVNPPPDIFQSSLPNENTPLNWYRLERIGNKGHPKI